MSTGAAQTPFHTANAVKMKPVNTAFVDDNQILITTFVDDQHPAFWAELVAMKSDSFCVGILVHNKLPPFSDSLEVMRDDEAQLWFWGGFDVPTMLRSGMDRPVHRDRFISRPLEWQGLAERVLGPPHCWVRETMKRQNIDSCVIPVEKNQSELPDYLMQKLKPHILTDRSDKYDCLQLRSTDT